MNESILVSPSFVDIHTTVFKLECIKASQGKLALHCECSEAIDRVTVQPILDTQSNHIKHERKKSVKNPTSRKSAELSPLPISPWSLPLLLTRPPKKDLSLIVHWSSCAQVVVVGGFYHREVSFPVWASWFPGEFESPFNLSLTSKLAQIKNWSEQLIPCIYQGFQLFLMRSPQIWAKS